MMIKNLLFDLGGVIMDIRRQRCVDAFRRLGMADPDEFLGEYSQKGPFKLLEEGSVTAAEFRRELRHYLPASVTDAQIDDAFMQFLIGIPVERLRELERLREKYDLYLLSNTNPIMWNAKIADEFRKDGHDIGYYFKGMVTSFEAKSMKPDPAIFRYAESTLGIRPEETLFFDDSQANVDAARALGFEAALVRPGEEFINLIVASEKK